MVIAAMKLKDAYSLEGMMLKLKLQYFGHLMRRVDSLEKSLMLGGIAKVGSQETPGVTGKFGLGIRNEAGQRLTEFCQENTLVIANTLFEQHKRRLYTWSPDGQH